MPAERLQKVLAGAGIASRRASERLIAEGRVRVDGRVAGIGASADPSVSRIEVDGRPVIGRQAPAYLVLHKPAGVTSTVRDRHAATTVLDLLPTALVPDGSRLYPVGRLDLDSEGLIFLTNDGDWAERVLHPRYGVQREYAVGLAQPLDREQELALRDGIDLDEGLATLYVPLRRAPDDRALRVLLDPAPDPTLTWYRAVLAQGWKRQLRRMFGAVGAPIERLVRVRIGPVLLDGLRSGRARALRERELGALADNPGTAGRPTSRPRPGQRPARKERPR
ncbi:MAG: rRNA pseudouridine synthase [Chloroflexi bacterium]|nr:rRNA pseudouridine synthase [Chloroflexota bacterium]